MMDCDDVKRVHLSGSIVGLCLSILCFVCGVTRYNPLKQLNYHTVAFAVYVMGLCYGATTHDELIDQVTVDGDLVCVYQARFYISGTIMAVLSIITTLKLQLNAVDVIVHALMAGLTQVFAHNAMISDEDKRRYWAFASISVSLGLILHMISESRSNTCQNYRVCLRSVMAAIAYMIIYFVFMSLGGMIGHVISKYIREVILTTVDCVVLLFLCLQIVRHAWAERIVLDNEIKPGMISYLYRKNQKLFNAIKGSLELEGYESEKMYAKAIVENSSSEKQNKIEMQLRDVVDNNNSGPFYVNQLSR